jgi:hypothetical protein
MLLMLVVFIWAVLGMNFLGRTVLQGCLNEHKNFQTVSRAVLTLFGVATGDGITCMIHATAVDESSGLCSKEEGDCGHPIAARLYFISFSVAIMFTTMEMCARNVFAHPQMFTCTVCTDQNSM